MRPARTLGRNLRWVIAWIALVSALVAGSAGASAAGASQILVFTGNGAINATFVKFGQATGRTLVSSSTLPSDLSGNFCVLLPANVTAFDAGQKAQLKSYVTGGGTIIAMAENQVFLGGPPAVETMNSLAAHVGVSMRAGTSAIDSDYHSTSYVGASEYTAGVSSIGYAYTNSISGAATTLVSTPNGTPFVGVQQVGAGRFVYSGDTNIFSDYIGLHYAADSNTRFVRNLCGDVTPPSVTIQTPQEDARYRLGEVVNAAWFCSDGDSGIATQGFTNGGLTGTMSGLPLETTGVAQQTVTKSFAVTCVDNAGNSATAIHEYIVDDRPPAVQVTVPGTGPYGLGTVVPSSWSCTDPDDDIATRAYANGPLSGAIPGSPIDTGSKGQKTYAVTCTDLVGNVATSPLITYAVPNSAPVATLTVPGNGARYKGGQPVSALWSCSDPDGPGDLVVRAFTNGGLSGTVSGVAIDTDAVSGTTTLKTFDVTCADTEDATDTDSATYTVDASPPVAAIAAPLDGGVYERRATIAASWVCTDPDGPADISTNPAKTFATRPVGQPIDTGGLGSRSFSVTCSDLVGNTSSKVVQYSVVDTSPPEVTITTPKDGATYGLGQVVAPSYACDDADGIGDIKFCVREGGTGPVNTSKPGSFSFTVSAEDLAGNTASKTVRYSVSTKPAPASAAAPETKRSSVTPARLCKSRREFRIRVKKRKGGVKAVSATVFVNGKRTVVRRGKRITATVTLKGLKKGQYKVVIRVRYSDGRTLSYTRRFKTCTPKGQ